MITRRGRWRQATTTSTGPPHCWRPHQLCNGESWGFRGEAGLGRIVGMEAVRLRVLLFFGFVAALPATAGAVGLCCATFRVKYNCRNTIIRFAQSVSAYTSSYIVTSFSCSHFQQLFQNKIVLDLSKEGYESLYKLYVRYDLWVLLHRNLFHLIFEFLYFNLTYLSRLIKT